MSHRHNWEAVRTRWPYSDGWGTYCSGCKTVLDVGLPKREAEDRARVLNDNSKEKERVHLESLKYLAEKKSARIRKQEKPR